MRFSSFTYLVGQGLHNLKANKMMTLASMGVLIVCMILVGAAFLFGANIDSMVAYIGEQNETVAFINDDADTAAVEEAIRSIPHVAGVEFISKDQMLDEYSQRLEGYTNLKEMFQNDNPLLANYVVRADDHYRMWTACARSTRRRPCQICLFRCKRRLLMSAMAWSSCWPSSAWWSSATPSKLPCSTAARRLAL